jgi:hypothetical protein
MGALQSFVVLILFILKPTAFSLEQMQKKLGLA